MNKEDHLIELCNDIIQMIKLYKHYNEKNLDKLLTKHNYEFSLELMIDLDRYSDFLVKIERKELNGDFMEKYYGEI